MGSTYLTLMLWLSQCRSCPIRLKSPEACLNEMGFCASMRFFTRRHWRAKRRKFRLRRMMWVWENRTSLIPEMPLKSLLFTIVKNKSLNSASRDTLKNRIIRQLAEHYEETFDDPDFYLEGELVQRLAEALRKMPPEFQQTFRMHRLEGMTHKEIAARLNVSPQTVNYRIGQTVRLLREELSDYWPLLVLLLCPDLS